ncbi:MAG: caspase family protein, partial [Pseudonocardiaceae bacterium]
MQGDGPGRRFLIATAIAHYSHAPQWNRPGLVKARNEIIDLFTGPLGYQHVSDLGLNPTKDQLTTRLRAFCRAAERRPDDMIAVYIAGHGEVLDGS